MDSGRRPASALVVGLVATGAVVAVLALFAWTVASPYLPFPPPPNERPEVATSVYAAVKDAGDGGTVDMRTAAPFEWDRMWAFPAYTSDDYVSQVLGFPRGTGEDLRLPNDGFLLLIFARERSVTGWVVLNDYESKGPLVEFADAILEVPIARADAVFKSTRDAEQTTGGWDIYTLATNP